ncbi:MAG: hypothetical protein ACRD3V_07905 [Vicinamibacteria bacterium]
MRRRIAVPLLRLGLGAGGLLVALELRARAQFVVLGRHFDLPSRRGREEPGQIPAGRRKAGEAPPPQE